MTHTSFFFLLVGVSYATAQFMRFILWLDTPRRRAAGEDTIV